MLLHLLVELKAAMDNAKDGDYWGKNIQWIKDALVGAKDDVNADANMVETIVDQATL